MELLKKYSKEITFLKEIDNIKAKVDDARPLNIDLENKILQKLRLDWNFNSNAIEGNSLTHGETTTLLMEGITAKGKPIKDALDIRGHNEAIKFLTSIIKEDRELQEVDLRNIHKTLLVQEYYNPALTSDGIGTNKLIKIGEYKTSPNHVKTATGEIHYYASPEDTPVKMKELIDWYNKAVKNKNIHPVVLASALHHRFVEIHPFDDGNGRMARLLTNLVLLKNGYPVSVLKNKTKNEYYTALAGADNEGDIKPLIELIGLSVNVSLDIYLRAINGEDISTSSDIDHDIELFMKSLDFTKEKVTEWTPDVAVKIAFETFAFLKDKLDKFERAFQGTYELIRNKKGDSNWAIVLKDELENFDSFTTRVLNYITKTDSACYYHSLQNDLKRNESSVISETEITFLPKTYIIEYKEYVITKFYGEKIIDSKIIELVNHIVDYYKTTIKEIYSD